MKKISNYLLVLLFFVSFISCNPETSVSEHQNRKENSPLSNGEEDTPIDDNKGAANSNNSMANGEEDTPLDKDKNGG